MKKIIIIAGLLLITGTLKAQNFSPQVRYISQLAGVNKLRTQTYEMYFITAAGTRDTIRRQDNLIKQARKSIGEKYIIYADTVRLIARAVKLN